MDPDNGDKTGSEVGIMIRLWENRKKEMIIKWRLNVDDSVFERSCWIWLQMAFTEVHGTFSIVKLEH